MRMVRYLLRFNTLDKGTLAIHAFYEQQQNDDGKHWLTRMKSFLDSIGMTCIHKKMTETKWKNSDIKNASKMTLNREKEIFEQEVFFEIDSKMKISKGKLLFFGQLKQ